MLQIIRFQRTGRFVGQNKCVSLKDEEIYEAISEILPKLGTETSPTVLGAGSDDLESGKNYLQALVEEGWMLPTWPREIRLLKRPLRFLELWVYSKVQIFTPMELV